MQIAFKANICLSAVELSQKVVRGAHSQTKEAVDLFERFKELDYFVAVREREGEKTCCITTSIHL